MASDRPRRAAVTVTGEDGQEIDVDIHDENFTVITAEGEVAPEDLDEAVAAAEGTVIEVPVSYGDLGGATTAFVIQVLQCVKRQR